MDCRVEPGNDDKGTNRKGDRVKIGMSGKFLPFRYDGATGNDQMLGYKEG